MDIVAEEKAYPLRLTVQEYHLIKGLRKADIQPSRISHLIGYYNEWLPHPVAGKQ